MQVQSEKRSDYPLCVVGFDEEALSVMLLRKGQEIKGLLLAGLSVGCYLHHLIGSDEMRRNLHRSERLAY
ncbi:hypothetical protein ID852_16815 [Xenorhabdus sp. 42]|uniref:hypothetical protein n=1 Tax=Xenorhabdus szentirmaii TaxID=290112 RepID=UPI001983D78E|nr:MULTISPECIES: hypothetical protein [unclassified Xenorhabdus]MBD2792174.1 hypothetical protein [Xenorhabdus sp. CUL]MBD2822314.1 hypothetical protein [Xenorhabdus sp. 42]